MALHLLYHLHHSLQPQLLHTVVARNKRYLNSCCDRWRRRIEDSKERRKGKRGVGKEGYWTLGYAIYHHEQYVKCWLYRVHTATLIYTVTVRGRRSKRDSEDMREQHREGWQSFLSLSHRRLQARACPGIARVISKHCVLISQGPDAKTHGMPSDQHNRAYAHTDVCIAYNVVTIHFRNWASNAA